MRRRRPGFELSTSPVRGGLTRFTPSAWLGPLVILSLLVNAPAQAATFIVNSVGDEAALAPVDGVACNSTAGTCTLRAAIEEANATPLVADTINFNIAPAGAKTIVLTGGLGGGLPGITGPVTIDGTTQPGFGGAPLFAPVIELNAAGGGTTTLDLQAGSSGSTIRGLVINRTPPGAGNAILVRSSNNVIVGNYLGTNMAGSAAGPGNGVGVRITGTDGVAANNNRVGAPPRPTATSYRGTPSTAS